MKMMTVKSVELWLKGRLRKWALTPKRNILRQVIDFLPLLRVTTSTTNHFLIKVFFSEITKTEGFASPKNVSTPRRVRKHALDNLDHLFRISSAFYLATTACNSHLTLPKRDLFSIKLRHLAARSCSHAKAAHYFSNPTCGQNYKCASENSESFEKFKYRTQKHMLL